MLCGRFSGIPRKRTMPTHAKPEENAMCEFCNGDREKQEPLNGQDEKDWTPILTVIGDKKLLSVIEIEKNRESLFPMNYCPMCGRKLEAAHNNGFNLTPPVVGAS